LGLIETNSTMEDILLETTKKYRFPILKANDFGHNCPNTVLPVGAKVRTDSGRKEIKILEKCVI
jgi:muramoyltetrapeptide carboxypeptidase